ncbi:hypothetical protein CLW00_11481 [Mongoliibacter ruber]|uniref:Uncharacterized protein n=1 Tax=Mongoliibacter ruber TaxID=1750599 RepID=A0A2T0WEN2_9BACT|nr:hypothetical protein CLW00_11481 [Mongoliibacter ruber]
MLKTVFYLLIILSVLVFIGMLILIISKEAIKSWEYLKGKSKKINLKGRLLDLKKTVLKLFPARFLKL